MNKKYTIIAGVITLLATMFTNTFASFFWSNQPKTPKCLK